jgi:hypothetical protein
MRADTFGASVLPHLDRKDEETLRQLAVYREARQPSQINNIRRNARQRTDDLCSMAHYRALDAAA